MVYQQSFASQMNTLRFLMRTHNRWITGHVRSAHRRVVDVLNIEGMNLLKLEEATVQANLSQSGQGELKDAAVVSVSAILFAVPMEEPAAAPAPADPFAYVKKRPERTKVYVGPYEVTGNFYMVEGSELPNAVSALTGRFFAISKATVTCLDDPEFAQEHDVVFVNREHAEALLSMPGTS